MKNLFDVCTFGSITVDLFIQSPEISDVEISNKSGKHPFFMIPAGEKIQIHDMKQTVGGGAANCSVGLTKLGLKSVIYGTVGNDEHASFIKHRLTQQGVNTDHISPCTKESSFSIILTSAKGRRTVFHHRSSCKAFQEQSLLSAPKSKAIYISHLYEKSQHMLFEIPSWKSKNEGCLCIWNPGKTQFKKGFNAFKDVFPSIDYLILNREEAESFTQKKSKEIAIEKVTLKNIGKKIDVSFPENKIKSIGIVTNIAEKFLKAGVKNVVITDGRNGAQLFNKDTHLFIPTLATPPFCTLGAGDAFAVGIIGARLHGKDFETQLQWGHANAASVVNDLGAQEGQLNLEEIKKF